MTSPGQDHEPSRVTVGTRPCGFCQTGDCRFCKDVYAKAQAGKDLRCPCAAGGHPRRKEKR